MKAADCDVIGHHPGHSEVASKTLACGGPEKAFGQRPPQRGLSWHRKVKIQESPSVRIPWSFRLLLATWGLAGRDGDSKGALHSEET